MTINHSFNDNILAISIKIDALITSPVTLAKAMKTSYVICSRNGWHIFSLALGDYKTALFLAKSGANLKVTDTWGNPVGFSLKNRLDTPEIGDSNYQYYREFLSILNADPKTNN